jgi:hypothetical protein
MSNKSKSTPESLMEAFNFTAEDLAANTAGMLTEQQRLGLINQNASTKVLIFFVMLGMGITFILAGIAQTFYVFMCLGTIVGFIGLGFLINLFLNAARKQQIIMLCGTVSLIDRLEINLLTIEKEVFQISQRQLASLIEGETYCIYYVKASDRERIMSIQHFSKPKEAFFES